MAVDVQIGGEYFVGGMYIDKMALVKDTDGASTSTAFFYQRLRLNANFTIDPGLHLLARMDVMERQWGAARGANQPYDSAATRAENENIAFDHLYVQYTSPVGMFTVGAMNDYAWGTVFGDRSKPSLKVAWTGAFGPVITGLQIVKETDASRSAVNTATTANDVDGSGYIAFVNYRLKTGGVGYLFRWNRNASGKPTGLGLTANTFSHVPYFKLRLGPVALEGEANYTHGSLDYNVTSTINPTANIDSWAAYLNADADFGMAYVGGTFAYLSGQINPDEAAANNWAPGQFVNATRRTGLLSGGTDFNPCLILWNYERSYFAGGLSGNNVDGVGLNSNGMTNTYFFQVNGGVRPVDKLDINLAVAYANAVVKPAGFLNNDYGWEVDLTATYKITNNLSYMLGGGYLFTGKFFKGASESAEVQNDYLVLNKLTLSF